MNDKNTKAYRRYVATTRRLNTKRLANRLEKVSFESASLPGVSFYPGKKDAEWFAKCIAEYVAAALSAGNYQVFVGDAAGYKEIGAGDLVYDYESDQPGGTQFGKNGVYKATEVNV